MTAGSRGGALAETLIMLGIALIVLVGTVQLGVVGFTQIAQDGAVFVAAHTYAELPSGGVSRATVAANSVYDRVPASAITVAPSAGIVTATTSTIASAPSIPGAPPGISLRSSAIERLSNTGTSGGFGVTALLSTYRDASGSPNATHVLTLAQPGLPRMQCDEEEDDECGDDDGQGGLTGPSAEWDCRLAAYAAIAFPSSRPTGHSAGPNSDWDPASSASPLAPIYQWDGGTSCN